MKPERNIDDRIGREISDGETMKPNFVEEIYFENKLLRERNAQLVAALERYGRHESWCETELWRPAKCTCGLDEALAR